MLFQYFKNRSLKKFIARMAVNLGKGYGKRTEYTEGQVKAVFLKLKSKPEYLDIAICVFCSEKNAKELGIDSIIYKKYRGYSSFEEHNWLGHGGRGSSGLDD